MERSILFDLELNRKRLDYYYSIKEKAGSDTPATVMKWIQIYVERIQQLEQEAQQQGLKFELEDDYASQSMTS